MLPSLLEVLEIDRCPYPNCGVSRPTLQRIMGFNSTHDCQNQNHRKWGGYVCKNCGGVVLAGAPFDPKSGTTLPVIDLYPAPVVIEEEVPERARTYLKQALESLHAPDGAVMLAASAVDAMLKEKGLTDGSLYQRIIQARDQHIITPAMAVWAHQVRLDANDPRHVDEKSPHHDAKSAERVVDFARALAQFLFILPSRITRGIQNAGGQPSEAKSQPPAK